MPIRFLSPIPPDEENQKEAPLYQRLGWFFFISLLSLLSVAALVYTLRGVLFIG